MHINNPFAYLELIVQGIPFGKQCSFYGIPIVIRGKNSTISIGNRFTLISGFLDNLVGLYQRSVIIARDGGMVEIGNDVSMSGVTVYSFNHIKIGNNTTIGANTKILDSDFHPVDAEIRLKNPDDKDNTKSAPITIGENVFIGCNTLILKGVKIGDGAVIGAGSVVTKSIPEMCIAAGNPAKVIRRCE